MGPFSCHFLMWLFFTPTNKAFHYQSGPFRTLSGAFYPMMELFYPYRTPGREVRGWFAPALISCWFHLCQVGDAVSLVLKLLEGAVLGTVSFIALGKWDRDMCIGGELVEVYCTENFCKSCFKIHTNCIQCELQHSEHRFAFNKR